MGPTSLRPGNLQWTSVVQQAAGRLRTTPTLRSVRRLPPKKRVGLRGARAPAVPFKAYSITPYYPPCRGGFDSGHETTNTFCSGACMYHLSSAIIYNILCLMRGASVLLLFDCFSFLIFRCSVFKVRDPSWCSRRLP